MTDIQDAKFDPTLAEKASQRPVLADGTYAFLITNAARETLERGKLAGVRAARTFLTPVKDLTNPHASLAKQYSVPYSLFLPITKEDGTNPPTWITQKANRELNALFGDEVPRAPYPKSETERQSAREAFMATGAKAEELWNMKDATGGYVDDMGLRNHLVFATIKNNTKDGKTYANVDGELMSDIPEGIALASPTAAD